MQVQLNGAQYEVADGTTLAELLRSSRAPAAGIAVEVNLELVRRAEWEQRRLHAGDRIEVVALVGGG